MQRRHYGFRNLATQGFLKPFAAASLFKTGLSRTEVGRSAHALIESEASVRQANDPPELLSIEQLPAGHAAPEDAA